MGQIKFKPLFHGPLAEKESDLLIRDRWRLRFHLLKGHIFNVNSPSPKRSLSRRIARPLYHFGLASGKDHLAEPQLKEPCGTVCPWKLVSS